MDNLLEEYGEAARDILQVLLPPETIQARVKELGAQISQDYAGQTPVLVGVLKGVLFFMADLLRSISIPVEVDFLAVSSYSPDLRDRGLVRLVKDLESSIADRQVLFVEDMVDTGLTLNYLVRNLRSRNPAGLEICTLFNKPTHRLIDLPMKYVGFEIPDAFIVGYGLDYRERFRNLPFVGVLDPQALSNGDESTPEH
ncbi:MAG TPA: hypoxanthine phosphoribosyltransferase [Anaerolineaceae bacterium]|nr:hypoxanthine phosphoribosyltransferase [Anaerolineaceae bacterium]